jgi:DNA-binding NarL/FixJ family response regulator
VGSSSPIDTFATRLSAQPLSGESPLNRGLAAQLLRHLADSIKEEDARQYRIPERFPEETPEPLPPGLLTAREVEVLQLVALGWTNRQIAQKLSVALSTVKNHVQHIIAKLGSPIALKPPSAPSNSAYSLPNKMRNRSGLVPSG